MSTQDQEDELMNSSSDDEVAVEWLAHGRAKRSNAGNRLQAMLSMEEGPDESLGEDQDVDEVNAIFMEDEEEPDEEFEAKNEEDADEDGDSSSSSDEDEQVQDELAGEKELQKEERAKQKSNKRKAEQRFVKPVKRVRISGPQPRRTSTEVTPARNRKKSERTSWTLAEDDNNLRTSSRTLSVQNKERTRESLKESEAKRTKQMAVMEAARERKQAETRGPLTQEDRLREAAEVERQNARSLNRWQELEEERMKRQKQKLEALQSRKIEGPMIRWWSGQAEWIGDRLIRVGRPKPVQDLDTTEEPKPQEKKASAEPEATSTAAGSPSVPATPFASSAAHSQPTTTPVAEMLPGIQQYASQVNTSPVPVTATTTVPPHSLSNPTHASTQFRVPYATNTVQNLPPPPQLTAPQMSFPQQFNNGLLGPLPQYRPVMPPAPPPPPVTAQRSMLSLHNFDPVVKRSTEAQRRVVFGLQTQEQGNFQKQSMPELCAVTAQRAKYRDPLTGMPYHGMAEFKRLRNLPGLEDAEADKSKQEKARWSSVLDAWVGVSDKAHPLESANSPSATIPPSAVVPNKEVTAG